MARGLFALITQALNRDGVGPEERKVTHAINPVPGADLRALAELMQDVAMGNLGGRHMADVKTTWPPVRTAREPGRSTPG